MKDEVAPPDPESLVAHRKFVEALARRLVDDAHVAEDLAQDTMLAALRRPPRAAAAIRGFLARVLRNRRARWLRDEERRLRRERAAARPDVAADGGDVVARLSWHRKVVDTLLTLEEPYRTTLLLRFYEDLKPQQIAGRLGVPAGTVRARLSRGLEQMRARLDADHRGDRRSWQLGLLPLLLCARPRGALLGVVAMTVNKKLVAAAALALALGGTGYVTMRALQPAPAPERADAGRAVAAVVRAEGAPDPTEIATPKGTRLAVRVRNERDEAIAGAEVLVLDTMPDAVELSGTSGALDRRWASVSREAAAVVARTVTNDSGEAAFAGLAGNRWDLVAQAPGRGRAARTVQGEQGEPVTLRLGPARALRGRVTDTQGRPIPGAVVLVGTPALAWWQGTAERPFRAVADDHGEYLLEALPTEDASLFASFPGGLAFYVATLRFPGPDRFDITLRRGGSLTGTVADGSGRAVANADVFVHGVDYPGGAPRTCPGHARTDVSGRYVIDTLPPCTLHAATVEAPGHVLRRGIDEVIPLREGETVTLDFKLVRGARIRGSAIGPGGPVSGAYVMSMQQRPDGGAVQKSAMTDEQGRFLLDDLLPGNVLVQVAGGGHRQDGFPANAWDALRTLRAAEGDMPWLVSLREGEEVDYVARLCRGDLVVEGAVLGPDGAPFGGAKVFAAGVFGESAADGSFRLEPVFADGGVVHVSAPGLRQVEPRPEVASNVTLRLEPQPDPRLVGTVRGRSGEPVEGAYVLLAVPGLYYRAGRRPGDQYAMTEEQRRWYSATRHAVTASGSFDVSLRGIVEQHDRLWLRAGAPGMADADPVEIVLDQHPERVEAAFVLVPGSALEGVVVDASNGQGLAGARVTVRRQRPANEPQPAGAHGPDQAVAAVTDEAGGFHVSDLGNGWWEIVASARGFVDGTTRIEAPARGPARVALARTLTIGGSVVLGDGTKVPHAFVQVDGMPGAGTLPSSVLWTDALGRFVAEDLAPGEYQVRAAASRAANIVEVTARNVPAGTTGLQVVAERGFPISGIVVDARGKGLPFVNITATPEAGDAPRGFAQTRDDGTFDVVGMREGTYGLLFQTPGKKDETQVIRRNVRAGASGLRVTFSPEEDERLSIEGVLVDEAGVPLPERWVRTAGKDRKRARTDAAGRFEIPKLEPGRHGLVLEQQSGQTNYVAALGDVQAGSTGIRLVARIGEEIRGTVSDGSRPLANAQVLANVGDDPSPIFAKTDARGAFRFTGIPPGATCTVSSGGGVFLRTAIKDVAAGTADVRIVLRRGLEARGRLLDADGAPLASATLRLRRAGEIAVGARTDEEGRFQAIGLAPGRYEVEAHLYQGGFRPCGTIEAGATDVELRYPSR